MTILLSALLFFLNPAEPFPPKVSGPRAVNRDVILQLVNDIRRNGVQCGNTYYYPVAPLNWNGQLESVSLQHSVDMEARNYFSHTAPDGSRAGQRLDRIGYTWRAYGENIGRGYNYEKEVVAAWIKSPAHCRNIMNGNYKEMGVARSGNYWTQTFGTR
jgi:uncharacterized protein YkwD